MRIPAGTDACRLKQILLTKAQVGRVTRMDLLGAQPDIVSSNGLCRVSCETRFASLSKTPTYKTFLIGRVPALPCALRQAQRPADQSKYSATHGTSAGWGIEDTKLSCPALGVAPRGCSLCARQMPTSAGSYYYRPMSVLPSFRRGIQGCDTFLIGRVPALPCALRQAQRPADQCEYC